MPRPLPPRPKALAVPLLACLGACATVDGAMYNLREVHHPDGTVRRTGAPMGAWEYSLRRGLSGVRLNLITERDLDEKDDSAIEDPLGVCLESLADLADFDGTDPRTGGIQVEAFTWLGRDDVYQLARAKAIEQLGVAGARLGLEDPPDLLPPEAIPATAAEVGRELVQIVRLTRQRIERERGLDAVPDLGEEPAEGAAADVPEACARIAALTLDWRGGRRVLALVNALLGLGALTDAERTALEGLSVDVQGRCVSQAIADALADESPHVRASAIDAAFVATGGAASAALKLGLSDPEMEVVLRTLRVIRERGLPRPAKDATDEERVAFEEEWLQLLVEFTSIAEPRLATWSCRALGEVSGAGFRSLRVEDWQAWGRERLAASMGAATAEAGGEELP